MTKYNSPLVPADINSSWTPFFEKLDSSLLDEIETVILSDAANTTPDMDRVLHFLRTDLTRVKVVILGQDPYPQKGVATGRAFEVGPLKSWTNPFRNTSLRNIVRALYAAHCGDTKTFNEIKKEMNSPGSFNLLPPGELFVHWEKQGVLLLNTSFSCKIGAPGSHSDLWRSFTNKLLMYINSVRPDAIWFLWGNHAREAVGSVRPKNCLITTHPMICQNRPNDFLFGEKNVFFETRELIDWIGYPQ
jgi:uracil-DNA glycosylase